MGTVIDVLPQVPQPSFSQFGLDPRDSATTEDYDYDYYRIQSLLFADLINVVSHSPGISNKTLYYDI